jgi:ubiquinone/menaquinone biosynthesis C-methylase UbiE
MSQTKSKKINPRIPEGEAILDQPELSMEQLNEEFKRRMREYRHFVKFILDELKVKSFSKVLELGPGPGWISILMVKENPTLNVAGLEISEDMIRIANKNVDEEAVQNNIMFIHGDAKDMNQISNHSYDVVISHDSLHHWDNPSSVFNEIIRVLKSNGIFCIKDGRRNIGFRAKLIFNIIKLFIPKIMSYYWKTSIMASYTPQEIQEILDKTALKDKYDIKLDLFDIIIHNKNSSN